MPYNRVIVCSAPDKTITRQMHICLVGNSVHKCLFPGNNLIWLRMYRRTGVRAIRLWCACLHVHGILNLIVQTFYFILFIQKKETERWPRDLDDVLGHLPWSLSAHSHMALVSLNGPTSVPMDGKVWSAASRTLWSSMTRSGIRDRGKCLKLWLKGKKKEERPQKGQKSARLQI